MHFKQYKETIYVQKYKNFVAYILSVLLCGYLAS